jgi:chaperonin GroES
MAVASAATLEPVGDRIIVRPVGEPSWRSGIIIPDIAKDKPSRGFVIAAGERRSAKGTLVPMEVSAGDEILYSKYGGTEIEVDGEALIVLHEADVLARVED